jgi:restriction endonuclease S subunit
METITQKIDLKNLDKSNWQTFRFDEIAKKISETVDPAKTDLDVYFGLEHLDAEDIHIRRKGVPSDVKGGKLKCYPGDIIFGKRRAYQRKAAIVEFEGICSAHAFVLRAIPEVIHPKLFPFFLHSDLFMHCAVDISVGGLSPTINWGQLKEQEFLLPPKEQQAQLAELLWAMDEVIEKDIEVLERLEIIYERLLFDFFENDKKYPLRELGDFVIIKSGDSPSVFEFTDLENGVPFYKVADLNESVKFQDYAKEWVLQIEKKIIPKNSIIFPKRGAAIMTNKVRITNEKCHIDTNTMALIVTDESILSNEFLFYFLYYKKLFKIADTSQIPQINNVHINPYPIHLPPISDQKNLIKKLNEVLLLKDRNNSKITSSKSLQKSLINQIF